MKKYKIDGKCYPDAVTFVIYDLSDGSNGGGFSLRFPPQEFLQKNFNEWKKQLEEEIRFQIINKNIEPDDVDYFDFLYEVYAYGAIIAEWKK